MLAPSIRCMKGDLATWFNASFMALFPRPLCDGLLLLRLWLLYSSSPEKVSLGGVLDRCLYVTSSVSSEEDSDPSDERLYHVRLAASRLGVQEIQHQDHKHHSCLLVYKLRNTPDQGNPRNLIQRI